MSKTVFFDTNSYRKIAFDKNLEETLAYIRELKKLEKKKDIIASGISTVATELLGNLTDSSAKYNYKECLNSLIAMGKHCYDDETETIRVTPTPYGHISKSLFGFVPPEFESQLRNIAGVLNDFGKNSDNALLHYQKQDTFRTAKEFLNNGEAKFVENIMALISTAETVVKEKYSSATKKQQKTKLLNFLKGDEFGNNFAISIVLMVSQVLQVKLSNTELIARANFLSKEFPVSIGFFKFICYKVVNQNIDLKTKLSRQKRWNWIWDYHVSFLCSNQKIAGREVILVTSDIDMREMLEGLNFSDKIFDLNGYHEYLLQ